MKSKEELLVNMEHVIGHLVSKYDVPYLSFGQLTELGVRAVRVYGLEAQAKSIPFADLCEYITAFIATPFGAATLKSLQ